MRGISFLFAVVPLIFIVWHVAFVFEVAPSPVATIQDFLGPTEALPLPRPDVVPGPVPPADVPGAPTP